MVSQWWRNAGLSYLKYSNICARHLRRALKPEFREVALKQERSQIKCQIWQDGKPDGELRQFTPENLSGRVLEK